MVVDEDGIYNERKLCGSVGDGGPLVLNQHIEFLARLGHPGTNEISSAVRSVGDVV
jgi:hypothetical protein